MFILHRIQSLKKSLTVSIKSNSWKRFPAKTIIENTSTDTDSDVYLPGKFITPFAPKLSADGKLPDSLTIKKTADKYDIISKCQQSLTFYVENTGFGNILLLSFQVDNKTIDPVVIDINNIRNKLSGLFAPYPNGNNTFHYQFSADSDSGMTKTKGYFSKGSFHCQQRTVAFM